MRVVGRLAFTVAVLSVFGFSMADAQIQVTPCGRIDVKNTGWQEWDGNTPLRMVRGQATTSRDINLCLIWLWAEVQIIQTDASAQENWDFAWALAKTYGWGSYNTTVEVRGKHKLSGMLTPPYDFDLGASDPTPVEIKPPEAEEEEEEEEGPECETGDPNDEGCGDESPIIIDMAGNGYHLTAVKDGVLFDIDVDGSPELVAWTSADSDDAFLAMDRNGNGRIDDGRELFGNRTPAWPDSPVRAANGFSALERLQFSEYGPATSPPDRVTDARDGRWNRLLLWTDKNHNGFSEPNELRPVAGSALRSISTECVEDKRRDAHGNEFRLKAEARFAVKGSSTTVPRFIYDVWLATR